MANRRFLIYAAVVEGFEITSDGEIQDATSNKVRRTLDGGDGIGVLQSLALLEITALGNAKSIIPENETPLIAKELSVSKIAGANK